MIRIISMLWETKKCCNANNCFKMFLPFGKERKDNAVEGCILDEKIYAKKRDIFR